jgi:hypothetical protein
MLKTPCVLPRSPLSPDLSVWCFESDLLAAFEAEMDLAHWVERKATRKAEG